jgi:hypothetical protein
VRPEQVPGLRVVRARGHQAHRPVGVHDDHVDGGQVVSLHARLLAEDPTLAGPPRALTTPA